MQYISSCLFTWDERKYFSKANADATPFYAISIGLQGPLPSVLLCCSLHRATYHLPWPLQSLPPTPLKCNIASVQQLFDILMEVYSPILIILGKALVSLSIIIRSSTRKNLTLLWWYCALGMLLCFRMISRGFIHSTDFIFIFSMKLCGFLFLSSSPKRFMHKTRAILRSIIRIERNNNNRPFNTETLTQLVVAEEYGMWNRNENEWQY